MNRASHDLLAAQIGIDHDAPLDTIAFNVQQCAEKTLKALLNSSEVQFPKTHDLNALLDMAVLRAPDLESLRPRLIAMGSYAVEMRYDDEIYPSSAEIKGGIETARELHSAVLSLMRTRDVEET